MRRMDIIPSDTVFRVSRWTRHEVATTESTIVSLLEEAYQSCTFGYDEPQVARMGQRFFEALLKRLPLRSQETVTRLMLYNAARIIVDSRMDSDVAHFYVWDRETYELPILFAGATVKLVDAL